MAATKTAPKTTRGARTKVQETAKKAPAKPANKPAGRTTAPKTTAKAATGAKTTRAARAKTAPAKAAPAKAAPKPVARAATPKEEKKAWSNDRKINPKTGFTVGTISDTIATALLAGGKSRVDIVNSIKDLPETTRNGTPLQRANVAATVEKQMLEMGGFEVVQSYKVVRKRK